MSEENKALVREYLAGVDTGDVTVIDKFVADGYHDHNPPPFQQGDDRDAVKGAFQYALGAFTDFKHEVVAQYSDGDYVISRIVGSGKHTGEFMGVPGTGQQVSMEGITIHRIEAGQVLEHWAQVDAANLLMQIGAIPPPA
ncbi:MAG TPA: ester cyclase [Mycobacteriales bacterium]|nr:ester cyclase [Mycobacteriales bacterium]